MQGGSLLRSLKWWWSPEGCPGCQDPEWEWRDSQHLSLWCTEIQNCRFSKIFTGSFVRLATSPLFDYASNPAQNSRARARVHLLQLPLPWIASTSTAPLLQLLSPIASTSTAAPRLHLLVIPAHA